MRWLLYGSHGWIGGQVKELLISMGHEVIDGISRVDNYQTTREEVLKNHPDRVLCLIGRTSGGTCGNIDYLEKPERLPENLRDNLQGPINLAQICQIDGIHMTYLGTGCIYEFDQTHQPNESSGKFTELDKPNFTGSNYSTVKGITDQIICHFSNVLNVRIRMPISSERHPRNFITKIAGYQKIISIPNSMTVLEELLPIMIDLSIKKHTGTINLTNPGIITHKEILDMYKEFVDPSFSYQLMDESELAHYVVGRRSNNQLDTTKLTELYPSVRDIHLAVRDTLIKMGARQTYKNIYKTNQYNNINN